MARTDKGGKVLHLQSGFHLRHNRENLRGPGLDFDHAGFRDDLLTKAQYLDDMTRTTFLESPLPRTPTLRSVDPGGSGRPSRPQEGPYRRRGAPMFGKDLRSYPGPISPPVRVRRTESPLPPELVTTSEKKKGDRERPFVSRQDLTVLTLHGSGVRTSGLGSNVIRRWVDMGGGGTRGSRGGVRCPSHSGQSRVPLPENGTRGTYH